MKFIKKIVNFFKKNWLFSILAIPFVFVCYENRRIDNDIWFLLTSGRYAVQHGVPTIDPFTIHEGLKMIMQQWLSASIFWQIYNIFGEIGLLTLMYVVTILLMFFTYKLFYKTSNNKKLSIIFASLAIFLSKEFIVARPQIFTYLILLIEVFLLESYVKSNNRKYLYALPLLSLMQINLHASMWYFQFIFLLPFLCNALKIKNISIESYKIKPLLITMLFMFVVGFINPYGYEAMTFIFKSYGISSINNSIGEMRNLTYDSFAKPLIVIFFIIILSMNYNKKIKLDVRHICFFCGTSLLAFMHNKCFPYFVFMSLYSLVYLFKDIKINKKNKVYLKMRKLYDNKYIKRFIKSTLTATVIMLLCTPIITIYFSVKYSVFEPEDLVEAVEFLSDNYNLEDITLFVDFNNGGYTEFKGIKSYIDPRAEVFFKKLNGKEDIYDEYTGVYSDILFDYEAFVNKYKFTHMIVFYRQRYLEDYMKTREDYETVYTEYLDDEEELVYLKIYALKETGEE